MLDKEQRAVARGIAVALMTTLAVGLAGSALPIAPTARTTIAGTALLGVALPLVASVARLAAHRFRTSADMGGSGLTAGTDRARLLQRSCRTRSNRR